MKIKQIVDQKNKLNDSLLIPHDYYNVINNVSAITIKQLCACIFRGLFTW